MSTQDLKTQIQNDMKDAMRQRDKQRLGTIRLILAALKQKEVDERITLSDSDIITILGKMRKQRQDSHKQYLEAGRQELADQEHYEIGIIEHYLPTPLSDAEVDTMIQAAITETGAASMADMGKVLGLLKAKIQGRADLSSVSQKIKAQLSS